MTKKTTFLTIFILFAFATYAGNGDAAFDRIVSTYNSSKGIVVNYKLSGASGNANGQIAMQGGKFCITASNMICWYNGNTQWSYSTMSGEVSIMEPTAGELQIINPLAAIANFKKSYNATMMTSTFNQVKIKLTPKNGKSMGFINIIVTAAKSTNLPSKIELTLKDKSRIIVTLTNYKTGLSLPATTFEYDKKLVPKGTQVVDLR